LRRSKGMGLEDVDPHIDPAALRARLEGIQNRLSGSSTSLLESQGVRIVHGRGSLIGENRVLGRAQYG